VNLNGSINSCSSSLKLVAKEEGDLIQPRTGRRPMKIMAAVNCGIPLTVNENSTI
jgi:hypothetical protein